MTSESYTVTVCPALSSASAAADPIITRVALGGSTNAFAYAQRLRIPFRGFRAPPSIEELYLFSDRSEEHEDLGGVIRWLREKDPRGELTEQTRFTLSLLQRSAIVTRYDNLLKFIAEDFWNNPGIERELFARVEQVQRAHRWSPDSLAP